VAALECACWDITAKALGRPLVDLLGGSVREAVPVARSIFQPTGRDFTAAEVVQEVEAAVEHAGLTTLKLKGGVLVPDEELVLLEALREAFPGLSLRLDPNGMWAVETTVRLGRRLEAVGLEYLEDPVWGVEPMSRARRDVRVPFATNMCVVGLADIPAAVRLDRRRRPARPARVGRAECGPQGRGIVSGAAARDGGSIPEEKPAYRRLFTCTSPLRSRCCRTRSTQVEEFIADPHRVVDGRIALPQGPGLGVEVDRQKLEYLARRNEGRAI
jgi:glucarate dehydratase